MLLLPLLLLVLFLDFNQRLFLPQPHVVATRLPTPLCPASLLLPSFSLLLVFELLGTWGHFNSAAQLLSSAVRTLSLPLFLFLPFSLSLVLFLSFLWVLMPPLKS